MLKLHLMDDALYELVEVRALLVIRGADVVYSVVEEETGNLVLLSLGVDRDGGAALLLYEGHTGDVGNTVSEVDHIAVRNNTVGHLLVHLIVIALVKGALGNAEDVLSLLGVVDGDLRPYGFSALLKVVLAGEYLLELIGYRAAVDDLLNTAGDYVMLDIYPYGFAVLIDPVKPIGNALVEPYILACGAQIFLCEGYSLLLAGDHRIVHISEDALHIVLLAKRLDLTPELPGSHSEIGNKGVVLHILVCKSLIKVVHKRGNSHLPRRQTLLLRTYSARRRGYGRAYQEAWR